MKDLCWKSDLTRQGECPSTARYEGFMDMDILFIGGVFAPHMEETILASSIGLVDYAANKLQWALIDGFVMADGVHLEVVSAPYVGAYPKAYKALFVPHHEAVYGDLVPCKYVPFCNLWGYRNISRRNSVAKETREFVLSSASRKAIVIYAAHTPFLQAAVWAKEQDPSIHLCLVVPDLPHFMRLGEKQPVTYRIPKAIDIRIFQHNLRYVDSFVLLTEDMKHVLDVGDRPYVVVEGMVNTSEDSIPIEYKLEEEIIKTIVYTGALAGKYGVTNLVQAFTTIDDPDIRLVICGRGDSEEFVKSCARKDGRIQFLGQISNIEAVSLQRNATILVNPRQNTGEFTKYSFPSKNIEYLLSGTPVIAYKLDGIPDEYDDYFFYVEDDSLESLSSKIIEVLSLTSEERHEFGRRAREFVINKKNNKEACARILDMIKRDMQDER